MRLVWVDHHFNIELSKAERDSLLDNGYLFNIDQNILRSYRITDSGLYKPMGLELFYKDYTLPKGELIRYGTKSIKLSKTCVRLDTMLEDAQLYYNLTGYIRPYIKAYSDGQLTQSQQKTQDSVVAKGQLPYTNKWIKKDYTDHSTLNAITVEDGYMAIVNFDNTTKELINKVKNSNFALLDFLVPGPTCFWHLDNKNIVVPKGKYEVTVKATDTSFVIKLWGQHNIIDESTLDFETNKKEIEGRFG